MILLEDSRQQINSHKIKNKYFVNHGIKVERTKLYCGDYTLPTDQSVCVDTKKDIQELVGNVCGKQHERFKAELVRAKESNIKLIILIENKDNVKCIQDLFKWRNPRLDIMKSSKEVCGYYKNGNPRYKRVRKYPRATRGSTLAKALFTMEKKYGATFLFCKPTESAPKILNLLGVNK